MVLSLEMLWGVFDKSKEYSGDLHLYRRCPLRGAAPSDGNVNAPEAGRALLPRGMARIHSLLSFTKESFKNRKPSSVVLNTAVVYVCLILQMPGLPGSTVSKSCRQKTAQEASTGTAQRASPQDQVHPVGQELKCKAGKESERWSTIFLWSCLNIRASLAKLRVYRGHC